MLDRNAIAQLLKQRGNAQRLLGKQPQDSGPDTTGQLLNSEVQHTLLRTIIDEVPDLIFVKATDGTYLECNPAFSRFIGRHRERIIGFNDYELFPPSVADEFRYHDKLMLDQRTPRRNEEWIRFPDGSQRLYDTLKTPFYNQRGEVMGLVGISRDITERKRNQKLAGRFRAALDSSADIILLIDRATMCFVDTNETACHNLGYTHGDLLGQQTDVVIPYYETAELASYLESALQHARAALLKTICRRKSGEEFPVEISVSQHKHENESLFIAMVRDISERNVMQKFINTRLEYEKALAGCSRLLLAQSDSGRTLTEALGFIRKAVPVSRIAVYERTEDEHGAAVLRLRGSVGNDTDLQENTVPLEQLERVHEYLTRGVPLMSSQDELSDDEKSLLLSQNSAVWLLQPIAVRGDWTGVLTVEDDNPGHTWANNEQQLYRTTSEILGAYLGRKLFELRLEEARDVADASNRAKSLFLANMSHEIRTPMNSILGFTELLLEVETDGGKRERLQLVQQSGRYLLTLINDILDLSKIEAGRLAIEHKEFSLHNLMNRLRNIMSIKANEKKLLLSVEKQGQIDHRVWGDPMRLNQILINLVSNAIRYTEVGFVKVWLRYEDELAEFRVQDSGVGIPEEEQAIIFHSFHQGSYPSLRKTGGTGLGLAITQSLVSLMHGTLEVNSIVGVGSEFVVRIPLPQTTTPDDEDTEQEMTPTRQLSMPHHRVMVFSDAEDVSAVVNDLREQRLDVEVAGCDVELVPELLRQDTEMLVVYVDHDVSACCRQLEQARADFRVRHIPVVVFSVHELDESCRRQLAVHSNTVFSLSRVSQSTLTQFVVGQLAMKEESGFEHIQRWATQNDLDGPVQMELMIESWKTLHDKLNKIASAILDKRCRDVHVEAHAIKGFTGMIGMLDIARVAQTMQDETMSGECDYDRVCRSYTELRASMLVVGVIEMFQHVLHEPEPALRILVAEDNEINQMVIASFLKRFDLSCDFAMNGREALEALHTRPYDILFLDMQMPIMDGMETIQRIRADEALKHLFVVALTAYAMHDDRQKYLRAGCDDYLSKPIDMKKLSTILDTYREKHAKTVDNQPPTG